MAKSLDTAASVTMASSGTLAADTTWMQSTGLIDVSGKNGMNVELKVTFTDNAGVDGDVTLYLVSSNDGGTDITSAAQAYPLAVVTPVQNTTVILHPPIPMEYILQAKEVGFGAKNEDASYSVSLTCSYQTLTL